MPSKLLAAVQRSDCTIDELTDILLYERIDVADDQGRNALILACQYGGPDVIGFIRSFCSSPN